MNFQHWHSKTVFIIKLTNYSSRINDIANVIAKNYNKTGFKQPCCKDGTRSDSNIIL